jgi:PD-(D/E)XK nuclease superfamily
MSGEQRCVWASWFRAHFQNYDEVPSDFSEWRIEHKRMLDALYAERINAGEQVFLEEQNEIRLPTSNGALVVGRPDLVTVSQSGTIIYDVKTGREKLADKHQVLLYMYLLPLMPRYSGSKPSGCVVYKDKRVPLPASLVDQSFTERLGYFLNAVTADAPARRESGEDCWFCEITRSDCHERVDYRRR